MQSSMAGAGIDVLSESLRKHFDTSGKSGALFHHRAINAHGPARQRRAIAYGIFNESSLRTQGPIRRGLSFLHWTRGLFSLLGPGVMGPCVRRDDPLRDCAKPRPSAEVSHMR